MKPDFCQRYSVNEKKAPIEMQEVPFKHEGKKHFFDDEGGWTL